jgi:hypothetical protein
MENGDAAVMVLTDFDPCLDEMRPQRAGWNLKFQPVERYAIVIANLALFLNAEDLLEIDAGDGHKRAAFLLRLDGKPRIVSRIYTSRRNMLAASTVVISAKASSFVRRSCNLWKSRSERPRACGE